MSQVSFQQSLPKKRMAAGAIIRNQQDELLIVKPTYRDDWLIPGGVIEADESPSEACTREIGEELGLTIATTRLLVVEYQHGHDNGTENIQFIFDGGILMPEQIEHIVIPLKELSQFAFVAHVDAMLLLDERSVRRVTHAFSSLACGQIMYMEDGTILK